MRTLTFYSYKGGVGRTLASANFAVYAARRGIRTAIVDFDLDAPGVASKLVGLLQEPRGPGLLDHILGFQETGEAQFQLSELAHEVPLATGSATLFAVPAGALDATYFHRAPRLHWPRLFGPERDGVAFFQAMLESFKDELGVELLILDSRAGASEIAGICTHQLADEVIIMASGASEDARMVRHQVDTIRSSEVARILGKARQVHVVLSRVPRNETGAPERPRNDYGWGEGVNLRLIGASPALAQAEFLAMVEPRRDPQLTQDYLELFGGLDVEVRPEAADAQLRAIAADLLSVPKPQSEVRLDALATVCPTAAMRLGIVRFHELGGEVEKAAAACWMLWRRSSPEERGAVEDTLLQLYVGNSDLLEPARWEQAAFREERAAALVAIFGRAALWPLVARSAALAGHSLRPPQEWLALVGFLYMGDTKSASALSSSFDLRSMPDDGPEQLRKALEHRSPKVISQVNTWLVDRLVGALA